MLKRAHRPTASAAASASAASHRVIKPSCPACHLSTRTARPSTALLHSDARALQISRSDHLARAEYFSSEAAAGLTKQGGSLRSALSFQAYKATRDAGRPADVPLDGRIPTTLPSLLHVFQYMSAQRQAPSKSAYYSLIEAAAEYSRRRNGEDVPALWDREGEGEGAVGVGKGASEVGKHERTGLGWKIAWSAWRDARAGGIDLGVRGFELLLEVSPKFPALRLMLTRGRPHVRIRTCSRPSSTTRKITPPSTNPSRRRHTTSSSAPPSLPTDSRPSCRS